jgi:hypothetical protein
MRTELLKYEWIEDNCIIDYNYKIIEMSELQYEEFINYLNTAHLTPKMALVDISYDLFDYNSFFVKVNENDGATRYYNYNVCGELTRFVDGKGNWFDRYEINPELMSNITELKNLIY